MTAAEKELQTRVDGIRALIDHADLTHGERYRLSERFCDFAYRAFGSVRLWAAIMRAQQSLIRRPWEP
jgi:hypothetical protein